MFCAGAIATTGSPRNRSKAAVTDASALTASSIRWLGRRVWRVVCPPSSFTTSSPASWRCGWTRRRCPIASARTAAYVCCTRRQRRTTVSHGGRVTPTTPPQHPPHPQQQQQQQPITVTTTSSNIITTNTTTNNSRGSLHPIRISTWRTSSRLSSTARESTTRRSTACTIFNNMPAPQLPTTQQLPTVRRVAARWTTSSTASRCR